MKSHSYYILLVIIFCFILVIYIQHGSATKLPSSITPCSISSPDFNTCAREAAEKFLPALADGIPELGMKPFEPLVSQPVYQTTGPLRYVITNGKSYGLTNITFHKFTVNQEKRKISMRYTSTEIFRGHYKASGSLLILPVTGDGDFYLDMRNIDYVYRLYYDVKTKDGKDYWKITKYKVTATPADLNFEFLNLFDGNKQLSDEAHKFAKENWKQLFKLFGGPVMKAIIGAGVDNLRAFFSAVPVEEFVLP